MDDGRFGAKAQGCGHGLILLESANGVHPDITTDQF
jgi:hypothetical protein